MTAYTPNLPALITALPGDASRAPQTEFTRARQVLFLENLSVTGSVRSAAAAGGVSHQTAYRARRSQKAFRLAWDAALVAARANAETVLACRAIDGVEEKVFYHGEEVATRTRYSDRLLLAHLARLDRLDTNERINAIAEDFDAALARFEAGEEVLVPAPEPAAGPSENFSPGPCNTRSKSYTPDEDWDDDEYDDAGEWDEHSLAEAMEEARPLDAPPLAVLGDPADAARCQRIGFLDEVDEWWTWGAGFMPHVRDAAGRWVPDPEVVAERARDAALESGSGADGGSAVDDEDSAEQPDAEASAAPALEPEPQPAPEPEATPEEHDIVWRPVNDGRMQPFYGRWQ